MPTNAVYQPTTVTYEQQTNDQRWNCPISYFSRRVTSSLNRVVYLPIGLCLLGSTLSVIGLALLIAGGVQYSGASIVQGVSDSALLGFGTTHADNQTNRPSELDTSTTLKGSHEGVGALIAGGVILFVGLLFIGAGAWAWSSRRGSGKEAPANGAAALTALNPSLDPLVAAQYAPVRDAPPAPDDEMRNLMDNKECLSSAEESDKMLDGRPSVA